MIPVAKFLKFILENQCYAISVEYVHSVSPVHKMIKVAQSPQFVLGITEYKGQIVTIIDLKILLKIPKISFCKYNLAINIHSENSFFAILADDILGVIDESSCNIIQIKVLNFNVVVQKK